MWYIVIGIIVLGVIAAIAGYFRNRKLSMPLGLSAMAKNDLRSLPSTRTASTYLPSWNMAPALNVPLMPKRSMQ